MNLLTMTLLVLGVAVSSVSGAVCYLGPANCWAEMSWVPQSELIMSNPAMSLSAGAFMVVMGVLITPRRVQ